MGALQTTFAQREPNVWLLGSPPSKLRDSQYLSHSNCEENDS